jgi:hypothetical protein
VKKQPHVSNLVIFVAMANFRYFQANLFSLNFASSFSNRASTPFHCNNENNQSFLQSITNEERGEGTRSELGQW